MHALALLSIFLIVDLFLPANKLPRSSKFLFIITFCSFLSFLFFFSTEFCLDILFDRGLNLSLPKTDVEVKTELDS